MAYEGDARRCEKHPGEATSSPDGLFDTPCPRCEWEGDMAYEAELAARSSGFLPTSESSPDAAAEVGDRRTHGGGQRMKYYLTRIEMAGNENTRLQRDTIYAELRSADGGLEIAATLDYVLAAIRDRGLDVEGVTVSHDARGSRVRVRAPRDEPKLGDLCELCNVPLEARDVERCLLRHEGCY